MSKIRAANPKGMRDFGPSELAKRKYIFSTIQSVFEKYGFQPIETPVMENLETLTGKYGEEGDKLLYKVLDSGDFYKKTESIVRYKTYLDNIINIDFFLRICERFTRKAKDFNDVKSYKENLSETDSKILHELLKEGFFELDSKIENLGIQESDQNNLKKIIKDNYGDILLVSENIIFNSKFSENPKISNQNFINRLISKLVTNRFIDFDKSYSVEISNKGLRYDLTIPFARYVVQNQNEIAFPFRRYQIQPVWRADRPQRGRYREFYQCDADIVGSDSLLNEVELAQIYADVFEKLGLKTEILINNRKVLAGFAEVFGVADKLSEFTVILDKLDKIGKEKVANEWLEIGVNKLSEKLLELSDEIGNEAKLKFLKALFVNSEIGQKGIEELEYLLEKDLPVKFSLTLARGLDYYTGTIFEVQSTEAKMGSIGGGGRYDNLTEIFGLKDMSGVGISFGVERIYDIMEELDLWPESILKNISTKILFINFGGAAESRAFSILQILRKKGIASEIYPSAEKFKKQMKYADQKGIPFVAFIGEKELEENTVGVKNMESGVQESYSPDALIELLS